MSPCLVEIPRSGWGALRDQFYEKLTEASAYNMLQNFMDWIAARPERTDVAIYALDDACREDGTIVAIDKLGPEVPTGIYANTPSKELKRLVATLNCLDLKETQLFCAIPERILPAVREHFIYAGCAIEDFKPDGTYWFHIARDKAVQFTVEPPVGISLGSVEPRHAAQVNSIWPHRMPGSVVFVERLIRDNSSVGAFDAEGNLVAWCLWLPTGSLGLLQVETSHKRRGLGSLVVRQMAKQMAAKNLEVVAPVVFENLASRGLFENLGFKVIDKVYWIMRNPVEVKCQ